jgi:hypothetical protein
MLFGKLERMDMPAHLGIVFAVDAFAFADPRKRGFVRGEIVKDVDETRVA